MNIRKLTLTGSLLIATTVAWSEDKIPADAKWIINDGTESVLVVREPEGPPPGLDLPPGVTLPPPQVMTDEVLGAPINTNILEVENMGEYTRVKTSYIPNYKIKITEEIMQKLLTRPKFKTDFPNGVLVKVGDIISFGQDIGYSGDTCAEGEGLGFWPPATFCATGIKVNNYIPNKPEPTEQACYTTLADVGIFLNGTVLFNWSDGQSFEGKGDWHNMAHIYEKYDFDVCQGHAVEGMYHHHGYSACLNESIGDTGTDHSPIWGYAADGYPIHGPYQAKNTLAKSCWRVRDFDSKEEGCGVDGERSCVMNDAFDPSSGTKTVSKGPAIGEPGYAMFSKNQISLDAGSFFEDYVYDKSCTNSSSDNLDSFNGHDHDRLGYHYHITVDKDMKPVFPYAFGPIYRGKLHKNAMTSCGADIMEFPAAPDLSKEEGKTTDLGDTRWFKVKNESNNAINN